MGNVADAAEGRADEGIAERRSRDAQYGGAAGESEVVLSNMSYGTPTLSPNYQDWTAWACRRALSCRKCSSRDLAISAFAKLVNLSAPLFSFFVDSGLVQLSCPADLSDSCFGSKVSWRARVLEGGNARARSLATKVV